MLVSAKDMMEKARDGKYAVGLKVGNVFGLKYKSRAEIAGGIILILLGVKILLEHLGVL